MIEVSRGCVAGLFGTETGVSVPACGAERRDGWFDLLITWATT